MTDEPQATPQPTPPAEQRERPQPESEAEIDRRESQRMFRFAIGFSAIGLQFGFLAAVGYYLGRWLDARFETTPWLSTSLVLLGIAVAFRDLFRMARRVRTVLDQTSSKQEPPP